MTKVCCKCRRELDAERFHKSKSRPDGLAAECKDCRKAMNDAYCQANHEKVLAEKARYYAEHREEIIARVARYVEEKREEVKARQARHYASHREKLCARQRAYQASHRDEVSARNRAYHAAHREELGAYARAYQKAHPDGHRQQGATRRARLHNSPAERFTRAEIYQRDRGICHLCHKRVDPQKWHLDHLVPISLGGPHTRDNVAVSHPLCNIRRNASGPAQLRLPVIGA
jgi:5-methylcytosine-specific restriction endonuclease McrA